MVSGNRKYVQVRQQAQSIVQKRAVLVPQPQLVGFSISGFITKLKMPIMKVIIGQSKCSAVPNDFWDEGLLTTDVVTYPGQSNCGRPALHRRHLCYDTVTARPNS